MTRSRAEVTDRDTPPAPGEKAGQGTEEPGLEETGPARPSASSQVWIPDRGHHKRMWFPAATGQRLRQVEGPRWREQLGSLRLETVLSPLRDLGLSPKEPLLLGPGHW